MFRSLKEKLKLFRKKAKKELKGGSIESDNGSSTNLAAKSKKIVIPGKPSRATDTTDKPTNTKIPQPEAMDAKQKLARKRSRKVQPTSMKRKIEKETVDQMPWAKVEPKKIVETDDTGWFAKAIPKNKLDDILWDLEVALLESDVALPVVEKIKTSLKNDLLGMKVKRGSEIDTVIEEGLRNAVVNVLQTEIIHFDNFIEKHKKPVKLMFVGVNGTGKTSVIAKIAFRLKKQKRSCVIAAGDTFRAGAIEQLEKHAKKLGVKLIKDKVGSDPAAIAYDAIEHGKARHKEVVLIDTAGRMQTNTNLMGEMRKIKRVAKPDMIIFVGDALAGNDVVDQAIQFEKVVGIDAAILTKIDTDAKGGAALSIASAVGKPIIFISVGQRYGDLIPFNTEWMVNRLFE